MGRGEGRGKGLEVGWGGVGAQTEKLIGKFASSLLPAGSRRESRRSRPLRGAPGSIADPHPGN